MKPYRDFFKRNIDVVAFGGALLVLAIPMAAITAWGLRSDPCTPTPLVITW